MEPSSETERRTEQSGETPAEPTESTPRDPIGDRIVYVLVAFFVMMFAAALVGLIFIVRRH